MNLNPKLQIFLKFLLKTSLKEIRQLKFTFQNPEKFKKAIVNNGNVTESEFLQLTKDFPQKSKRKNNIKKVLNQKQSIQFLQSPINPENQFYQSQKEIHEFSENIIEGVKLSISGNQQKIVVYIDKLELNFDTSQNSLQLIWYVKQKYSLCQQLNPINDISQLINQQQNNQNIVNNQILQINNINQQHRERKLKQVPYFLLKNKKYAKGIYLHNQKIKKYQQQIEQENEEEDEQQQEEELNSEISDNQDSFIEQEDQQAQSKDSFDNISEKQYGINNNDNKKLVQDAQTLQQQKQLEIKNKQSQLNNRTFESSQENQLSFDETNEKNLKIKLKNISSEEMEIDIKKINSPDQSFVDQQKQIFQQIQEENQNKNPQISIKQEESISKQNQNLLSNSSDSEMNKEKQNFNEKIDRGNQQLCLQQQLFKKKIQKPIINKTQKLKKLSQENLTKLKNAKEFDTPSKYKNLIKNQCLINNKNNLIQENQSNFFNKNNRQQQVVKKSPIIDINNQQNIKISPIINDDNCHNINKTPFQIGCKFPFQIKKKKKNSDHFSISAVETDATVNATPKKQQQVKFNENENDDISVSQCQQKQEKKNKNIFQEFQTIQNQNQQKQNAQITKLPKIPRKLFENNLKNNGENILQQNDENNQKYQQTKNSNSSINNNQYQVNINNHKSVSLNQTPKFQSEKIQDDKNENQKRMSDQEFFHYIGLNNQLEEYASSQN